MTRHPLTFQVLAQCKTTKAKCSRMTLPHHVVETPVFMPVGKRKQILFIFIQLKTKGRKITEMLSFFRNTGNTSTWRKWSIYWFR
jgi:hypothetical protein